MKKTYEAGTYIKAYGGNFGLYYDGKKWVSFECLGCAIAKGLVTPSERLHNSDHPNLNKRVGYNYTERHNKEIHNEWLEKGKPYKK